MKRLFPGALLALVAAALLLPQPPAEAGGQSVTFVNKSTRTQHVLAFFGGTGSCPDMSSNEHFALPPGEKVTVESEGSKVCYCVSPVSQPGSCGGAWKKAKAGSKVRLH